MSLLDLASLVLAPTATKEGKVYSAIPDTGEGDMTFTRGSSATRVNSAGLIEKERGNLLLQSNTFDTTWLTNNASVTGEQSGYDGSSDAWLLEANTASTTTISQGASISGVMTASIYAKAGTTDWFRFSLNDTSINTRAWFDLTNGVVGLSYGNMISTSILDVGDGWYRCSITFNSTAANVLLFLADANGSISPSAGDNIYIQDAMLNQGLVAQSYIETTTSAVYEGITDDVPRVDYSGGGCPSLLLEPSRTQLLPQSEYANSSDWNNGGTTYENNAGTSPEGVDNAIKVSEDTSTAFHYLGSQKTGVSTAGDYTISGFIKKGSRRYAGLRGVTNGFVNRYFVLLDLNDGSVVDTNTFGSGVTWSHNVSEYANGWYRIEITGGHTSGTIDATFGLSDSDSPSYTGGLPTYNGVSGEHIFCYGIMIEAGSYSTSYIPTYGVSSTRVADTSINYNNANLPTGYPFTLYAEINVTDTSAGYAISFLDSSVSNFYYTIEYFSNVWHITSRPSGSTSRISSTTPITLGTHKLLGIYTDTTMTLYLDGTSIASGSNSQSFHSTINDLLLGQLRTASDTGARNSTKEAIVFNTELSSDEAIALTTI